MTLRIAFAFLLVTTAASVQATIILEYETLASTASSTLSPTVEAPSVTGDPMEAGTGLIANSGGTWNWRNWADGGVEDTSFGDAVADNDYWIWGFDVDVGNISLTKMDIRVDRSGTGPNQFEIQASVNGGVAVSLLTHDFGELAIGVDFIDVNLVSLGTVSIGDSVDFILAAFGADSGGATAAGTFDLETIDAGGSDPRSLRIYGDMSSAVPVPATLALVSLGIAGIGCQRRKRTTTV